MKKDITYVNTASLLAILNAEGLTYTTQSGFHKVEPVKGRRLYIAATKRCGRIDLSGFEVDSSHAQEPHCGVFGAVKQQMIMTGTEEEVGSRFVEILRTLKTLAPVEPKPKAVPVLKEAKPTPTPAPKATPSKGTKVSKKNEVEKATDALLSVMAKKSAEKAHQIQVLASEE